MHLLQGMVRARHTLAVPQPVSRKALAPEDKAACESGTAQHTGYSIIIALHAIQSCCKALESGFIFL
jgi:hypothetical protein